MYTYILYKLRNGRVLLWWSNWFAYTAVQYNRTTSYSRKPRTKVQNNVTWYYMRLINYYVAEYNSVRTISVSVSCMSSVGKNKNKIILAILSPAAGTLFFVGNILVLYEYIIYTYQNNTILFKFAYYVIHIYYNITFNG